MVFGKTKRGRTRKNLKKLHIRHIMRIIDDNSHTQFSLNKVKWVFRKISKKGIFLLKLDIRVKKSYFRRPKAL